MTDEPTDTLPSPWDEPKLDPSQASYDLAGEQSLVRARGRWLVFAGSLVLCLVVGSVVYAMTHRHKRVKAERDLQPKVYGSATGRVPESIRQLELATTPATPTAPPKVEPEESADALPQTKPEVDYADEQADKYLPERPEPAPRYAASTSSYDGPPRRHQDGESPDDSALPSMDMPAAKESQRGASGGVDTPSMPLGLGQQTEALGQASQQLGQLQKLLERAGDQVDDDERKEAFAAKGGIDTLGSDEDGLAECDLSAGRPVPGNVLVATNSDIPAKNTVTITVSQTIYCGADRQHVALPQGSKFVGSVDAKVVYGQERLQLCMHQLERPPSAGHPRGSRKQLGCAVVADITGQTGMLAEVDNHWSQLIGGALLSTVLSLGASASMGTQQGFAPNVAQNAAHSAGSNISQVGQRIVQRDLMRKPTLKTEQLEGVVVIFSSNLELEPWTPRRKTR